MLKIKNIAVQFHFFKHLFTQFLVTISLIPPVCLADAERILKTFKENSKAVVVVFVYNSEGNLISQGSGFIIRPGGPVVTNYHVIISGAADIKIKAENTFLKVDGPLHKDKGNNIVILKADDNNLPVVEIGDISKVKIGEKVYVISGTQDFENTISEWILSGIRESDPKMKILQIPISKDSSRGLAFNKNGEVIGMATSPIEEAQNLNFSMPTNLIENKIIAKEVIALKKDSEIEDYKKSAEYWFNLGVTYANSGMYKEAIEAFKQAIRIKPNFAEAHYNLGLAYDKLGMYKKAIETYKRVIKIKPNFAEAHYNLGLAYTKLEMYEESIEAFKQVIKIKPDFAEAHYNLGLAYEELGMYEEAMEEFKEAIRINPDYAEAHYNLGIAYAKLEMYEEAIGAFKEAIRINPDYAEAYNNLGSVYAKLGMYVEAIEAYNQAIKINPDYANAHYNLGLAYAKLGMYEEAIEAYKQAIKINPDDAEAHYNLGLIYLILNEMDLSLEQYKILKRLNPDLANRLLNRIYMIYR